MAAWLVELLHEPLDVEIRLVNGDEIEGRAWQVRGDVLAVQIDAGPVVYVVPEHIVTIRKATS